MKKKPKYVRTLNVWEHEEVQEFLDHYYSEVWFTFEKANDERSSYYVLKCGSYLYSIVFSFIIGLRRGRKVI